MFWTSMPKATVDKDCHLFTRENYVSVPPEPFQRSNLYTEAQSKLVKSRADF